MASDAPFAPPPSSPSSYLAWLECSSDSTCSNYDIPINWWSTDDQSLFYAFIINGGLGLACTLLWLLLARSPTLLRLVYRAKPVAGIRQSTSHWATLSWREAFSSSFDGAEGAIATGEAMPLDEVMLVRYLSFNLRLLLWAALPLTPILLLVNGLSSNVLVNEKVTEVSHLALEAAGCDTVYSGLQALSLTHLPSGSSRFFASFLAMCVLTFAYLAMLRKEWTAYVGLRHRWLAARRVEAYAVLVRVGSDGRSPSEIEARLRTVFPGEVHSVRAVPTKEDIFSRLAAGVAYTAKPAGHDLDEVLAQAARAKTAPPSSSSAAASSAAAPASAFGSHATSHDTFELVLNPGSQTLHARALPGGGGGALPFLGGGKEGRASGAGTGGSGAAGGGGAGDGGGGGGTNVEQSMRLLDETMGQVAAEAAEMLKNREQGGTLFFAFFRTRRAASVCAQSQSIFPTAELPAVTRPAPAPGDVLWDGLTTAGVRKNLVASGAALFLFVLFAFWATVVAFIQSLLSVTTLEAILGDSFTTWLSSNETLYSLLAGVLPSLVLTMLQAIALYSGILTAVARAFGYASRPEVEVCTLSLMWWFNYVLVLLGSCISGNVYDLYVEVVENGICELFTLLADSIPQAADYFLSYVLLQTLLYLPLLDGLQATPLLLLALQAAGGAVAACLPADAAARLPSVDFVAGALSYERPVKYAKAALMVNICLLFHCVAPVATPLVLAWLALALRLWCHNLLNVWHPAGGAAAGAAAGAGAADSGGVLWPEAMQGQTVALQVAQLTLASIQALNACYGSAALLLLLLLATGRRAAAIGKYFGPMAASLPLQECVALDGAMWAAAAADKKLVPGPGGKKGGAKMPEALLALLSEADAGYVADAGKAGKA